MITQIQEVDGFELTHDRFYHEFMTGQVPVIIRGGLDWAALKSWSYESLVERYGDEKFKFKKKEHIFKDVLAGARSSDERNPASYLKNAHVQEVLPCLMKDVGPFKFAAPNYLVSRLLPGKFRQADPMVELFIGGDGTKIPHLHYDEFRVHNFITQVVGRKHFWFYPPEQTELMYPRVDHKYFSSVRDPRNPDLERFPRFKEATPQKFVVEPGDSVFVAPGWWHWTLMPEFSVALGHHCVNATNWNVWVNEMCDHWGDKKPWLWWMVRMYMLGVGPSLHRLHPAPAARGDCVPAQGQESATRSLRVATK